MRIVALVVCLVIPDPVQAQEWVSDLAESVLRLEVDRLRQFADVSGEERQRLLDDAVPVVTEAINKTQLPNNSAGWLWPDVLEEVTPLLNKSVDNRKGLAAFLADTRARHEFERQALVDAFGSTISSAVGLTRKQRDEAIPEIVKRLYDSGRLPLSAGSPLDGAFVSPWIKKFDLTEEQLELWEKNGRQIRFYSKNRFNIGPQAADREATLTETLSALAKAKVAEIAGTIELDAKARRKLEVAAKGAVKKMVAVRMASEDEYRKALNKGLPPDFDTNVSVRTVAQLQYMFLLTPDWRKLTKSALSEDHWQALEKYRTQRYRRVRRLHATRILLQYARNLSLSGTQKLALRDYLTELVPTRTEFLARTQNFIAYKRLYFVSEEKYIELMGEANFKIYQKSLDANEVYYPNREGIEEGFKKISDGSGAEVE